MLLPCFFVIFGCAFIVPSQCSLPKLQLHAERKLSNDFYCIVFLFKKKSSLLTLNTTCCRSSRLEVFCKKGVLKSFANFLGKHLRQSLFFNKVEKKRPWHRCFPVNFSSFFKNIFFHKKPTATVSVIA